MTSTQFNWLTATEAASYLKLESSLGFDSCDLLQCCGRLADSREISPLSGIDVG